MVVISLTLNNYGGYFMNNSLFFCGVEKNDLNSQLIEMMNNYSEEYAVPVYIINAPLGTEFALSYDCNQAVVVLSPKHKVCFVNLQENQTSKFEDFCDDFIEDLGHLSEKFDYRSEIGRPRVWRNKLVTSVALSEIMSGELYMSQTSIDNAVDQRNADFLISLLIGSINDINRIGGNQPTTLLDQVKKKIILFDGDQSRFIYSQPATKKRISIQGLAGTGKTELLLHKLKDLYTQNKNTKIVFTCFNKILAQSMKKRVPEFFNFMRVEEQIKWNERLWVMPSWGSQGRPDTGVYSYICTKYNLQFHPYSFNFQFDDVCQAAIKQLKTLPNIEECFDYVLVDESQDFPKSFFDLCELVTRHVVYIAGDIFQDIYDRTINQSVKSDYLLNKCYRTDPKTLMFAHAVGMGLYEKPVIRWLDDDEWESCGYIINRTDSQFSLSRVPLRRFEDIDTAGIRSIEILDSNIDNFCNKVLEIIDSIRSVHNTVCAGDIAIVFLENDKENYKLADQLGIKIPSKYSWNVSKGYETKDSTRDAVFISNRNNIKGLEFPFVICVARGMITDNVFSRNTIYMMLTRSFITSYFLVNSNNTSFIETYQDAASAISNSGKMVLREPPEHEKEQQNKKVRIAVAEKQRPIKEIIEEVFNFYPDFPSKHKKKVIEAIIEYIEEEGGISEQEIQTRTRKLIDAFS